MPKEEKRPPPEVPYPEIAKLLETENFGKVNKDFTNAYDILEKISKSKGLGKAADARKGMKAIERVMDLLRELLRRKYQLMKGKEEPGPKAR